MEDYTKISHKRYSEQSSNNSDKKITYLRSLLTRSLLSVILVISLCIIMKVNTNSVALFKEYILTDSLEFTKINKWYQDKFGKIIPSVPDNSDLVFSNSDLKTGKYTTYLDGVKIEVSKGSPISLLCGGIVVYLGDKEDYGNTLIIQGNDGIDYWYGGITSTSVNLYDYLEKDTLIGEAQDNFIYLVLQKDNTYLSYEEYLK